MNAFELTSQFPAIAGALPSYYSVDLLVLATPEKLLTAQVNAHHDQLIALSEYEYKDTANISGYFPSLSSLFESDQFFQKPYRREIFAIDNAYSTLVPEDIFDESQMKNYLSLSHVLPTEYVLMHDEIKGSGVRNVFCIPGEAHRCVHAHFPSAGIHHLATPLLTGLNHDIRHYPDGNALFCHLRNDILDLVVFKSGKLIYHNSFVYNNHEEFIYYILFVLEQLSLTPTQEQVIVTGDVDEKKGILDFAKNYIGGIQEAKLPIQKEDVLTASAPDLRRYYTLLSLRLCE